MTKRFRLLLLSIGVLLLLLGLAGCAYQYHGALLDPPKPIQDFSMPAHTGDTFQLNDYRGEVVLVYFGYTYCPDVCPTTLYQVKRAMAELGNKTDEVPSLKST